MEAKNEETTKPLSAVDKANEAIEKLEAQNTRMEENIARLEELKAEQIVSGKADAGTTPVPPKELTAKEYKDKLMRGEL